MNFHRPEGSLPVVKSDVGPRNRALHAAQAHPIFVFRRLKGPVLFLELLFSKLGDE